MTRETSLADTRFSVRITVMPAKAGIHWFSWTPAFAGVTIK